MRQGARSQVGRQRAVWPQRNFGGGGEWGRHSSGPYSGALAGLAVASAEDAGPEICVSGDAEVFVVAVWAGLGACVVQFIQEKSIATSRALGAQLACACRAFVVAVLAPKVIKFSVYEQQ